jgi:hypothetical protein
MQPIGLRVAGTLLIASGLTVLLLALPLGQAAPEDNLPNAPLSPAVMDSGVSAPGVPAIPESSSGATATPESPPYSGPILDDSGYDVQENLDPELDPADE